MKSKQIVTLQYFSTFAISYFVPVSMWLFYLLVLLSPLLNGNHPSSVTAERPLIPRKELVGGADKWSPAISVSGKMLVYLAPFEGVINLWLQTLDFGSIGMRINAALPVTFEKEYDILGFEMTYTEGILIYWQDRSGLGNNVLYKLDLRAGWKPKAMWLTSWFAENAKIVKFSNKFPDLAVIAINYTSCTFSCGSYNLFILNITSGTQTLLYTNGWFHYKYFAIDHNLKLRLAANVTEDGDIRYYERRTLPDNSTKWIFYDQIDFTDASNSWTSVFFDLSNTKFYTVDSKGRNFNALYLVDFTSRNRTLLYGSDEFDIEHISFHPTQKNPLVIWENYKRSLTEINENYKILDKSDYRLSMNLMYIRNGDWGKPDLIGCSMDMNVWLYSWIRDDQPLRYHIFNRKKGGRQSYIFSTKNSLMLDPYNYKYWYNHARMRPVEVHTQEEHHQLCYITIPRWIDWKNDGQPSQPIPMIVTVRRKLMDRTSWGFDFETQFFASRGYAVLQCNFRGSTGLGKEWVELGHGEIGRKMQDDLIEGVKWAIDAKIADPDKIAIFGEDYGGYATLNALAKTPEVFACGVDVNGYSNLVTLAEKFPERFAKLLPGKFYLQQRSPYYFANKIKKPLLVFHKPNDLVPRNDSDFIVDTLKSQGIRVTYVVFPNEESKLQQHRKKTDLALYAITEKFLANCLGGRAEPADETIEQSSAEFIEKGILTE